MLAHMFTAAGISRVLQRLTEIDFVMPSQITGILASGRSVIPGTNPGSEILYVVRNKHSGIVVEPDNTDQMLKAVMGQYCDGPTLRQG